MTTVTPSQEPTRELHPQEYRGIEELLKERDLLKQKALAPSSPRATAQRLADWNRRAEETLNRLEADA